jgi:hypothetical protein
MEPTDDPTCEPTLLVLPVPAPMPVSLELWRARSYASRPRSTILFTVPDACE